MEERTEPACGRDTADGIRAHFVMDGQIDPGGNADAVTGYAQTVSDEDLAARMDDSAVQVLSLGLTTRLPDHPMQPRR